MQKINCNMLSRHGYVLDKSQHPLHVLQKVRKDLTVRQPWDPDTAYGPPPKPFTVFLESKARMYLPRFYAIPMFGPALLQAPPNAAANFIFKGTLKEELQQPQAVAAAINAFKSGGGMLCIPTGWGKTTTALYLAAHLGLRTLVLVHKTCLADQWAERISTFLDGALVGRLQGPVVDVESKNIVIAMIQSVCLKDYSSDILDGFGLLIVDEAHHEAAAVFSQALLRVNCTYVLALSATPERKDGMSFINEWFLGPIFFRRERRSSAEVTVQTISYDHPSYKLPPPTTSRGQLNLAAFLTLLSQDAERNHVILRAIARQAADGRRLLVLSDRRAQCEALVALCHAQQIDCGLYLGGMKQAELQAAENRQVLISTYGLVSEGFDKPELSCLILATPRSDVHQASGRILRETPGKTHAPLIIDIRDLTSVFYSQYNKRKSFYSKQGFTLQSGSASPQLFPAKFNFLED